MTLKRENFYCFMCYNSGRFIDYDSGTMEIKEDHNNDELNHNEELMAPTRQSSITSSVIEM